METKECSKCSREFTRHRSYFERGGRFCSIECNLKWRREDKPFNGDKHWRWRGGRNSYRGPDWKIQAELARIRDRYKCRDCGIDAREVHHIIPYKTIDNYKVANDLSNLITLCRSCHRKYDALFEKIYPDLKKWNTKKTRVCRWCHLDFVFTKESRVVCPTCSKRLCKVCNREFRAYLKTREYCSLDCMYNRNRLVSN